MIVAVCADKGAPGVTTLALALGMVWQGPRVVLEADPSGADLPFRTRHEDGGRLLAGEPSVLSLAADARAGLPADALPRYTQPTTVGVPVIPGALSAEAYSPMRHLWPQVAAEAARWPGTVIADLGRLQPGHSGLPLAQAATAVLLVAWPTLEGLHHLRDRVTELGHLLGDPSLPRPALSVVVVAEHRHRREAEQSVTGMLAAAGSPIALAGVVADDPAAARALNSGDVGRRLTASRLLATTAQVAARLLEWWPQLGAGADWEPATSAATDGRAGVAP